MLSLKGLRVRYETPRGPFEAVRGVDLEIEAGAFFGLVGESGCGKSSLGRAALRLEPIAGGQIIAFGEDITHAPPRRLRAFRQRAAMIFQDPYASFNPRRTILDAVMEPLRLHRPGPAAAQRDAARALLARVGLSPELEARRPHALSGGQLQRAAIARALALEPALIVADEAVSALDVSVQAEIVQLLKALRAERGLTYLFIAHNLHLVAQICDRVGVMYAGALVEVAAPEEIFTRPRHPYTRALIDAAPSAHRRAQPVTPPRLVDLGPASSGCAFAPRCPQAHAACLRDAPALAARGDGLVACYTPL